MDGDFVSLNQLRLNALHQLPHEFRRQRDPAIREWEGQELDSDALAEFLLAAQIKFRSFLQGERGDDRINAGALPR